MIDNPGSNLYKPPDDRVYGSLEALAPECGIPNHVEQIVSKISDGKPGLVGCKPMAARLIPSQGVPPLFYGSSGKRLPAGRGRTVSVYC